MSLSQTYERRGAERLWAAVFALPVLVQVLVPFLISGKPLVTYSDLAQFTLLLVVTASMLVNVRRSEGPVRLFWLLMAMGSLMWAAVSSFWVYFEVVLRGKMPQQYFGDIILYLHLVPMMSAVFLAPHVARKTSELRRSTLDFVLLVCWWVYLYASYVEAWNSVARNSLNYGANFNIVYHLEGAAFILSMVWMAYRSKGEWRKIFIHYSGASALYMASSSVINYAIEAGRYHSGGLYDIPLVAAMSYFAWTGFYAYRVRPQPEAEEQSYERALPTWVPVLAVLAIPLLAFLSAMTLTLPEDVRDFRVQAALAAMLLLSALMFLRQWLMTREVAELLGHERRVLADMQRLQSELVQSEKLASIGRLVSGAAHEINNPLTAILGYSDLLVEETARMPEQRTLAEKIRQQAIRTRGLVTNLLAFARQKPGQKRAADVNLIVSNACQLQAMKHEGHGVRLLRDQGESLPPVMCDESQLMQVLLQLFGNAFDSVESVGGGTVTVRTRGEGSVVHIEVEDTGAGMEEPGRVFDPFYTTKAVGQGTGLGLSASYGIVHEHGGEITCRNLPDGGACFTVSLPVFTPGAVVAGKAEVAAQ